MTEYYFYIAIPIMSLLLALIITKPIRRFAMKISLVDNPNARKVHKTPIPLVGGIVVFTSSTLAMLILPEFWEQFHKYSILFYGSLILLIMGVIDDKVDLRASLKLVIQLALAHFVFTSGIRIETMFDLFRIGELPMAVQYGLTIIIIVGVVNAFNLTDGIDGLAAGLAIVGFSAYSVVAFLIGDMFLFFTFISLVGALIGFLRFNLGKKYKVFMGDAGSLVLGFVLVVSGIILLQQANHTDNQTLTLATVIGVLALPVADSLRVYRQRIKTGYSPFRADKTHFHHLVLLLGLNHKVSTVLIILIALLIITLSVLFGTLYSLNLTIIGILIFFFALSTFFGLNREMDIWKQKIREMENKD